MNWSRYGKMVVKERKLCPWYGMGIAKMPTWQKCGKELVGAELGRMSGLRSFPDVILSNGLRG